MKLNSDAFDIFIAWFMTIVIMAACANLAGENPYEPRRKIAIIDTGVDLSRVSQAALCYGQVTNLTAENGDRCGHGTNISGIILPALDIEQDCLLEVKVFDGCHITTVSKITQGLAYALSEGPAFLNFSISGHGSIKEEERLFRELVKYGTIVSVSAGNDGTDLSRRCIAYPACYSIQGSFYPVGASDLKASNHGGPVKQYMPGYRRCALGVCLSGTSQSAAEFTRKMIEEGR